MNSAKRRSGSTALIGVILAVVAMALFFLLTDERETVDLTGLAFLLIGIIVPVVGLISLEKAAEQSQGVLIRSGGAGVLIVYGIAAVIAAVFFIAVPQSSVKILVAIQLVMMAFAAILFIVLLTSGRTAGQREGATLSSVNRIRTLTDMAQLLAENPANAVFSKDLKKIYEALRYGDAAGLAAADEEIEEELRELSAVLSENTEEKEAAVQKAITEIQRLIRQRSIEVREGKRGSI